MTAILLDVGNYNVLITTVISFQEKCMFWCSRGFCFLIWLEVQNSLVNYVIARSIRHKYTGLKNCR